MSESFIRRPEDPGYIVAWRHKYDFQAGKYAEEVMSYGEARQRAEELATEHPERSFWPERHSDGLANRFYNPKAH